jgi:hypothetical protein
MLPPDDYSLSGGSGPPRDTQALLPLTMQQLLKRLRQKSSIALGRFLNFV